LLTEALKGIGAADNKLFIGPIMRDQSRDALLSVARCCSGAVYLASIPHPNSWQSHNLSARVWRLQNGQWAAC